MSIYNKKVYLNINSSIIVTGGVEPIRFAYIDRLSMSEFTYESAENDNTVFPGVCFCKKATVMVKHKYNFTYI